jgi:hypothetical protein
MNGKRESFTTTLPSKFITILRKHALIEERINMSEMLERYQAAYLREQEREKAEKKAAREKEQAEKEKK